MVRIHGHHGRDHGNTSADMELKQELGACNSICKSKAERELTRKGMGF